MSLNTKEALSRNLQNTLSSQKPSDVGKQNLEPSKVVINKLNRHHQQQPCLVSAYCYNNCYLNRGHHTPNMTLHEAHLQQTKHSIIETLDADNHLKVKR